MSWEIKTIQPKRAASAADRERCPSPPLMRFFAAAGFSLFSIGSLKASMRFFGFDAATWMAPTWSSGFMLLVVGSLIAGFVGGLSSLAYAAQINVRNERTNYVLSVLWHYLANGTLVLSFLLVLTLSKRFDKESARRFVLEFGPERF
jgi:hypothetical protein